MGDILEVGDSISLINYLKYHMKRTKYEGHRIGNDVIIGNEFSFSVVVLLIKYVQMWLVVVFIFDPLNPFKSAIVRLVRFKRV